MTSANLKARLLERLESAAANGVPLAFPSVRRPASHDSWGDEQIIPAEAIRKLLLASPASIHPRGLELRWARVTGVLNLADIEVPHPLTFVRCAFERSLILSDANVRSLKIEHSWIPRLEADGLVASGSVSLLGSSIAGGVSLRGAQIGGYLDLDNTKVRAEGEEENIAVRAERLRTQGAVFLRHATVRGTLMFRDASVRGGVAATDAKLRAPSGRGFEGEAFDGERIRSEQILDFRRSTIEGSINLAFAETRGSLVFDRAICKGQLTLTSAVIGGNLRCRGATIAHPEIAVDCQGLTATDVSLCDDFHAYGQVRLRATDLRGELDCSGGCFENPTGIAIDGQGIRTRGNLFLQRPNQPTGPSESRSRFVAKGNVDLVAAHIGGAVACHDAAIEDAHDDRFALNLSRCEIGTDLLLIATSVKGTRALGLYGATINGDVNLSGAQLEAPAGVALFAASLRVGGALTLAFSSRPHGRIDLAHAKVGRLGDTPNTWPQDAVGTSQELRSVDVTGFEYDALVSDSNPAARRQWLREAKYSPQPFEHLARLYRNTGHETRAREIAIEKRNVEAAHRGRGARARATFLRSAIGYGYKPRRALGWLLLVFVLAGAVSWLAGQNQAMVATKAVPGGVATIVAAPPASACKSATSCVALIPRAGAGVVSTPSAAACKGTYPCFNPVIYAAEDVLPIVNLHQAEFWAPDGSRWPWLPFVVTGLTLLGWLLTSLLVAALAGFIRRN
jgi:hypothetical protein